MRSNVFMILLAAMMLFCSPVAIDTGNTVDREGPREEDAGEHMASGARPGSRDAPLFVNVTGQAGLAGVRGNFFSWGDYNNDGYEDLLAESRLFRNNGPPNWDFSETTDASGLSGGGHGTWADFDNDGLLDLYMVGSNRLWKNDGPDPYGEYTFTDVTSGAGIESYSHVTAVGWGDYDNDGFVDLYIARGENWNDGNAVYYPNALYRNEGDGTFTNVTADAGVAETGHPSYSRGVAWADYNDDGWLDLYVANYRQQLNYLYENNGDGTFTDVAPEKGVADGIPRSQENLDPYDRPGHSVGAIWGDYDCDGDLDLWVTNLNHKDWRTSDDSLLYRNDGAPDYAFTNVRGSAGIQLKPYVAPNEGDELFVGCAWEDFDLDGYLDLYLPQVYGDVGYAYSFLYQSDGDGTFTDVTEEAGVRVWDTYASSWCDYDNDGMADLLTAGKHPFENGTYEVRLYRNGLSREGSWLKLILRGTDHNSRGIGATVWVEAEGRTHTRQVEGGMGAHGQQNSFPLDFGLGDRTEPVDATIVWGPGKEQVVYGLEVNREHVITEVRDKPDLELSALALEDSHPVAGRVIEVHAEVTNMGMATMERATLGVYLDDLLEDSLIGPTVSIDDLPSTGIFEADFELNTTGLSGKHLIKAYVFDSEPMEELLSNNMAAADIHIRFRNEPPEAVLDIAADIITVDEPFAADGSGSGDDVAVSKYMFDFGDGSSTGWISEALVVHRYGEIGEYEITLHVMDSDGAPNDNEESATVLVTEPPNLPPTAEIVSVSPGEAVQGRDTVEFEGRGTDDDGTVSAFSWRSSLDGHLSVEAKFSREAENLSVGEHIVFFRVRDDVGEWSEEVSGALTVLGPNSIPEARIESISPSPSESGEVVRFSGRGIDIDGEITAYRWESSIDGFLSDEEGFSTSELFPGEHEITFTVTDDQGARSPLVKRHHLVKGPNRSPTCRIVSYEPVEPVEGEPVILYGEGSDPEGDDIEYHWRSDRDGQLGTGDERVVEMGLSRGVHVIYLSAVDEHGDWSDEDAITITVGIANIRPRLTHTGGPSEGESEFVSVTAVVVGLLEDDFQKPVRMEFRMGGSRWEVVDGDDIEWEEQDNYTRKWTLKVKVLELGEGMTSLNIRVFDGTTFSNRLSLKLNVRHMEYGSVKKADETEGLYRILGVGFLLLIMIAVIIGYSVRVSRERRWKKELRASLRRK